MKRKIAVLGIAAVLAVLTACTTAAQKEAAGEKQAYMLPAELTYEKETLRYGEMQGAFSFVKDMEKTKTDCAHYYFEAAISREEREECIAATDRVLHCIDGTLPDIEIAVFAPESYEGALIDGSRFYTSVQPWDSAEYLAGVLLAGYGGWGNYGLAYGYANYLCREAGMECREAERLQTVSMPELYDLNLLCFTEGFAAASDVEAAKNNACRFVDVYLTAHREEDLQKLLSESATAEGVSRANEALEAFYEENGVTCSLSNIRYQYGGVSFDYGAACAYAGFYIEKGWQDALWEQTGISENFLHEDYGTVRAFFACIERQMGQYQELFALDSYRDDLSVFFSNGKHGSDMSFYGTGSQTIYLKNVVSLMHEYIHFVMDGYENRAHLWTFEGFARHFDSLYDAYAYDFLNQDWNNAAETYASQEMGFFAGKYIEHIGRPLDSRTDTREFYDFLTYAYGWKNPDLTYFSGASFVAYLVDCYGLSEVIPYLSMTDTYNAAWGKSYEELVQDWNDYIEETCSWYEITE